MWRDLSHDWSSGQWPRLVSINTHCHNAYEYDYNYGPLTNPRRKKLFLALGPLYPPSPSQTPPNLGLL
ncbi:hypothetical protein PanWU01x14_166980 [Parasponia andersonii]|uniref:Uncharacterized protein n=1 Tax=Parasponia andersonii TaxID=3476 RepID=A0A2P5CB61_PARAD|nr:hypothetical protein PanWU01x14_166980 [Parasponia andersonii]